MNKLYIRTAYIYLIILAILGVILRSFALIDIHLNFKFILHTHSHIAFLGWVYSALFAIYIDLFSTGSLESSKKYRIQFISIQIVNLGMLISFPIQGYALFSIIFSTLHIIIYYWFARTIYLDIKGNSTIHTLTKKFANASLLFLIVSSVGPFVLPVMIKLYGTGSNQYFNTIYYYLHFQYNGWFTFSILAFVLRSMELKGIIFDTCILKKVFATLFYSTFLILFLSFLWTKPSGVLYAAAGIGSCMQVIFLFFLYKLFSTLINAKSYKTKPISKNILKIIIVCLISKILFQCIGSIPYFANLSYEIRNFMIGYLHLFLIGVITLSIVFICIENDYFNSSKRFRIVIYLFLIGFLASEFLIFSQGIAIWMSKNGIPSYNTSLIAFSLLMMLVSSLLYSKLK